MNFLSIQAVSRDFGGVRAVDNMSLEIQRGKITSLIGPNGAGKTTLVDLITGLTKLTSGNIYFEGTKISGLPAHRITKLGIARTFQLVRLFDSITLIENVLIGRHVKTRSGPLSIITRSRFARAEEYESYKRAHEILEFLNLDGLDNKMVTSLPLGQQKLAEVARALAADAKLLLLDEPAAGLNPQETQLLKLILYKILDSGTTILLIEHDMGLVMKVSDHIIVMSKGQKLAEGKPHDIAHNREVIAAYLGEEIEHVET